MLLRKFVFVLFCFLVGFGCGGVWGVGGEAVLIGPTEGSRALDCPKNIFKFDNHLGDSLLLRVVDRILGLADLDFMSLIKIVRS